ncbi:MAG: AMP-binding protein, partial [Candidatus Marinimicrobia bacterium]|nr:AMP-binding protein [Candidatus Neomarinimicrobiota bacterium]
MKANWTKRTLSFKLPAGTSRGVMKIRNVWYITLSENGITGIGECAPLPGLSLDLIDPTLILPYDRGENKKKPSKQLNSPFNRGNTRGSEKRSHFVQSIFESKLDAVCTNPELFINDLSSLKDFPSIRFGLEMAILDLRNGGGQNYFGSFEPLNINGLIWMGDPDFMINQLEQKLDEGWQCIKIKIGAIDFDKELEILQSIRSRFSRNELELRVDANGAFTEKDVRDKLKRLAEFDLHSIEQPIQSGQWNLLAKLCESSPVPIALDEELIPLIEESKRIEMLDKVKPQYLVLKPSLLGGFSESEKWIQLANERNIGWWITSALESNIGLNALFQWTAKMKSKGYQGLGTGQLFTNNIPSPLKVKNGTLDSDDSPICEDINQFISEWYSSSDKIVLQTSGSTGKPKSISVKKEWMQNSAQLTEKTFGLKEGDTALLCMPMKYVAGKMMVVRALELGLDLKVVEPSSSPLKDIDGQIDFVAMVPLQLENSLNDLDKVKTLIVGGGQVSQQLIEELQKISTQIFETYGMTETLTHVAIKPLNGPNRSDVFHALDGIQFGLDDRGCLVIHVPSILSLRANPPAGGEAWQSHLNTLNKEITSLQPPRNDNSNSNATITSNDIVELIDDISFRWLGRYDNVINSGGVKIIPEGVESKLASAISNRRFFIAGLPDESLGEKVVLIIEGDEIALSFDLLEKHERPKEIYFIRNFVETGSGKI